MTMHDRTAVPGKRRRATPSVVALEDRALLSAPAIAHGLQPARVSTGAIRVAKGPGSVNVEGAAEQHSLSNSSTHVTFPGGFVNSFPGGTKVKFPGGFVNSRPGRARVKFTGGFVNSFPGGTNVTFPGGFVHSSPGGTTISFPGGSIQIG